MAKGVTIIEGSAREPVMDKNYYVTGIEEFIIKDDNNNPIFKLYGTTLKTGIKFRTQNGEEGPAMMLTAAEFIALVQTFGAKDFAPKGQARMQSAVLLEGQRKANEQNKMIVVESRKGYVNAITDMHPPEGQYEVVFKEAFSPKFPGTMDFSPGNKENSEYMLLKFEIVNHSVWEGFILSQFMNNSFVDYCEIDGVVYSAIEGEKPVLAPGKSSERWVAFGTFFGDNLWARWEWATEPSKSPYGVCEVQKPQYVLINQAIEKQKVVKVWYQKKERSNDFWFDMIDLKKFNEVVEDREATIEDFVQFIKDHTWYKEDGETEYSLEEIISSENPLVFTGPEWAVQYLGGDLGPWNRAGLDPNDHRFEILSSTQLGRLMEELETQYA